MNGIDKITSRISSEAKAEVDALMKMAQDKAAAVAAEYAQKAEAAYAAKLAAGKNEIEQQTQRSDRTASLEARRTILAAKQEMVGAAYEKAAALIAAMPENSKVAFLAKLAVEAAENGVGEVLLSAADKASIGSKVVEAANALLAAKGTKAELKLGDAAEIAGGLILKNGNISANCTLESLLEMSRSKMDAIVAGILFN